MPVPAPRSVWVIVPAYNEEGAIGDVISSLRNTGYRILVVDDGSRDGTADRAVEAGASVLRHMINLGQGAALQTGIDCALLRGADYIVTFDADGQHEVTEIGRLLAALNENEAEFALGSRFLGEVRGITRGRRILLRGAALFTRVTTGLSVTDSHNGFRAMTRRGASSISLRQNRMAHASEILHQIARSGLHYTEVPVTIKYTRYSVAKGQRSSEAISILLDLFVGGISR